MPIRFGLDSDILGDLEAVADVLMTYSDLVPNDQALAELHAKFPRSEIVLIDRGLGDPTGKASVLDVETGAATIGDAPSWYDRKHAEGIRYLTIYSDRNNVAAISQAMGDRHYFRWVATLDGTVVINAFDPLHAPAVVQCLTAAMLGIHADGNLILEDGWHPQPTPGTYDVIRRDTNAVISHLAVAQSELHRMATALGG